MSIDEDIRMSGLEQAAPPYRSPAGSLGRVLGFGFVVVVVLALVLMLGYGLASKQGDTGNSLLAHEAPNFTLELFDGGAVALSDLRGQPVVVNFWASWCPTCREEAADLEKVWRDYKDRGVAFLGVNVSDVREDALGYIKEFDVTYSNGPDPGKEIYDDYGVTGFPETFFVNRQGIIVRKYVGPMDQQTLGAFVGDLLQ
jgi:cytochrome c biogenesis protein CcmG/thiol:disulfide interchange protein DsbE